MFVNGMLLHLQNVPSLSIVETGNVTQNHRQFAHIVTTKQSLTMPIILSLDLVTVSLARTRRSPTDCFVFTSSCDSLIQLAATGSDTGVGREFVTKRTTT